MREVVGHPLGDVGLQVRHPHGPLRRGGEHRDRGQPEQLLQQTVDVTRGLMQQLFGLSSVAVLTASSQGTVRVPHLETDIAQRVADDLAHRAEQVRDQAT